ncbi:MAG: hypothetical protein M1838_003349 [Thelocarpon superellum]|nr:MAG: hypothetical protein M1838_003349 [Thelocarpon superellum]
MCVCSILSCEDVTDKAYDSFLSGQMHVLRSGAQLTSILLVLVPLVGASMIAISRCEDYRHDVYDVTVGSLLGLVVAHLSYRRYYPALRSPHCHTPYPSPAELAMIKDLRDSSDDYGTIPTRSLSGDGGGRIEESLPLREVSIDTDRDLERGHG